jgi:predicted nucleic acid-binding protein
VSYLLDTNVVSEAMKKMPEPAVVSWLAQNQEHCFLSSITVAEIELGIELLPTGQKRERLQDSLRQFLPLLEERVLPFDVLVARQWAKLCAQLEREGRKTPVLDSMIEATALQWKLTAVTRNTSDFVQAETFNPWKSRA